MHFPIPLTDRYRDIVANPDSYQGKLVIGELYIKHLGKNDILLSDSAMTLSRYKVLKTPAVSKLAVLNNDFVLVKGRIRGLVQDERVAGYPETFVVIEPSAFALSPKSLADFEGNPVPVPAKGEIDDERCFRNVLREANALKGRIIYWNLVVYKVSKGKVWVTGPFMSDIKAGIALNDKLRSLRLQKNDKLLLKARIVGRTTTWEFGHTDEIVLNLNGAYAIEMARANDM